MTETFAAGVTLPRMMTVEEAELEIRPLRERLWKTAHGGPFGQSMENSARVEEARRQLKALRYLATMASRVPELRAQLVDTMARETTAVHLAATLETILADVRTKAELLERDLAEQGRLCREAGTMLERMARERREATARADAAEARLSELQRHFDARGTALDAYGERERAQNTR